MAWLSLFTAPDFDSSLDCALVGLLLVMMPLVGLANIAHLPLFNRGGGLFTYSKFAHGASDLIGVSLPTRAGMVLLYAPAGLVATLYAARAASEGASVAEPPAVRAALLTALHFGKRVLECLFLHKYSGTMPLLSSLNICSFYCLVSWITCWYSTIVPPAGYSGTAQLAGGLLFAIGLAGNCYHHWLLATLRKPGQLGYKVPTGGLFELVAAPHYLFELVGWFGVALVAQHALVLLCFLTMTVYLFDRAVGQSEWNRTKLEDYPPSRKHIVPYLF